MSDVLQQADPHAPATYFAVARLDDGRYCVELVRPGSARRKSYAREVSEVVRQLVRAGRLPVQTDDAELRRACDDQQIELLER